MTDGPPSAGFVIVAVEDELWDGEMARYEVDRTDVLLVRLDGKYRAYDDSCPHQGSSLADGTLDGYVLTCATHEWVFDARTGAGINPRMACLTRRAVRVADGCVLVSRGREPAHPAGRPLTER